MKFRLQHLVALTLLFAVAFSIFGCSKYKGFKKHETGYYYQFHQINDTAELVQIGDWLGVNMVLQIGDSVLFEAGEMIAVDTSKYEGDFNTALLSMRQGDSVTFIFGKDQFAEHYLGQELDFPEEEVFVSLKIYDRMPKVEVDKLIEAYESARAKEPILINQFLTENGWDMEPSAQGIYFKEIKKGKGDNASIYDMVTINYTGKLLTGEVFDSSEGGEPIKIQLGVSQVIPGWNFTVSMMNKGEIAEVVIPSQLAYHDYEHPLIPRFSPLHFTIEIIDIEKAPEGGFQYK
ncbi:FKBP-type peptidyl-prolyl cis-trans isomerase [Bacteroidales bacterium OttesenSCG-928-B11]|nr:FKBP-type peptidyl-prolyl cis-trans isomerase [Bacteroidales bacterium OttesenSCG-928-B11]MDL2326580.1 FKBP-type peptidyl-prolyl cis-trans isomerase [Bacteroidales bacterium OttesenSCG-928-A14]